MTIVQVNVVIYAQNPIGGNPNGSGYEKVSRSCQLYRFCDLRNEVLLFGVKKCLKRLKPNINVKKLINQKVIRVAKGLLRRFLNEATKWRIWAQISLLNLFQVTNSKILSLTIFLALLRQNVESSPGMTIVKKATDVSVTMYNCNGLRDKKKLRRLLGKVRPIVEKGGIVLLQETHITYTEYLSTIWKRKFESNCKKTNSAGVIILYNKDFENVDKYKDENGRLVCIAIEKDEIKLVVANVYFPNKNREGTIFAEDTYLKILEFQHKFPEYHTILGGDFNLCMKMNDSLNRNTSNPEKCLAIVINHNNSITSLTNCYRAKHSEGGYTWKRGNCYSSINPFICVQISVDFVFN